LIELVSNSLLRCAMLFCFVLFLSLTGCATAPVLMELKPDWVSLQQVNYWTVKGRVAFRNGNEGWHGRISWVSSPLEDKIKIAGPIGQGAIVILMRGDVVEVLFSDGRKEVTRDPAALLERQLGFSVPLKALRWWIRGLPEEKESFDIVKNNPDSIVFRQGGWLISQRDFRLSPDKVRPYRLKIESEKLSLKFVIDRWEEGLSNG